MEMTAPALNADEAFRQAGSTCFVKHNAKTIYVVATDDYLYPACGDHLTVAIRAIIGMYESPEIIPEFVTVYSR